MSGYYHGQAGPYPWNYGQAYMAPEPPSRPLDPRQRPTHEGGEGRPPLQRKYHSEIEPYGFHAANDFEKEQHLLGRHRQPESDMTSARRGPSPARIVYGNERPPLHRQYYSDNEPYGHLPTETHDIEQDMYSRPPKPRHQSRKQAPSPPRGPVVRADHRWEEDTPLYAPIPRDLYETKPEAPSPPPIPGAFDRGQAALPSRINPASLVHDDYDYTEPSSDEGVPLPRKTKEGRRKPPLSNPRRKEKPQAPIEIELLEDDYPPQRSLQYHAPPPPPAALLSPIPETKPRKKQTATKTSSRRATVSSVQIQQGRRSVSSLDDADDLREPYYALPPPPVDRRRHSDIDVTLTRVNESRDEMESTGRRSRDSLVPSNQSATRKRRNERKKGAHGPLVVPGSFPSGPDELRPEDSRSDIIPLGKKAAPVDTRSIVSGTTLRQSGSASASGTFGENALRYKPLGEFEFRLVRLLARTMSVIKCELVTHSLEDPPDYIALSYAWGDTDDQKRIQLEGVDVSVSANLHGALSALRAKKESVLIWVDALSIDQQSREEKARQVEMMTEIYENATSVAIWLGPEADNSNLAMQTLSDIASRPNDTEKIKKLIIPKTGKERLSAVVALFEREYWSRLWPVQEIFNAEELFVHCGTKKVPWPTLRLASKIFWNHKGLIDYHYPSSSDQGGPQASSQLSYSQILACHGPGSIPDIDAFEDLGEESLLEVLRACRKKLCTDPRDKLYGILGLVDEDIRNEFPIEYSLSVREVYVRVFDYLLCTTEHLNVLCEAMHSPINTGSSLPTWIPDWSYNPDTTALGLGYDFSAAGSTKAVARVLDDRKRLEVSAIYLDTIQYHGIVVGTRCTLADYIMAFLHWRALLFSHVEDGESAERQEEFCRTLSLDKLPSEWEHRSWRVACYNVFAAIAHETIPKLSLDRDLSRFAEKNVGIEPNDRGRFLQEHFGSRMKGRCFCITEEGHIGMGSAFMAAGDVVVIPLGCRTPVLLRPEGSRGEYKYVGDVYIEGYMHGEAVDEWKSGEQELRKYILH